MIKTKLPERPEQIEFEQIMRPGVYECEGSYLVITDFDADGQPVGLHVDGEFASGLDPEDWFGAVLWPTNYKCTVEIV